MFSDYFEDWEVKPEFSKQFVSLWSGWLGAENCHKLDEVTADEWSRFNDLLKNIANDFALELANFEDLSLIHIVDVESVLSTYEESMSKTSSEFINVVVPALGCVISEGWDYTYIIWHKNNGAVEALDPYIKAACLEHFHD